jgi:transposase
MPRRALILSAEERGKLTAAQQQSRNVRHWRRYQAVLLRAEGLFVKQVAQSLGCTETRVYNWTAAYRTQGVDGVHEGRHLGAERQLNAAGERLLGSCSRRAIRRRMAPGPPAGPPRSCRRT